MERENIKELASAIMLQAVKDYCRCDAPLRRKVILKDLRSSWMVTISDGESIIVAERLELYLDEIKARVCKHEA